MKKILIIVGIVLLACTLAVFLFWKDTKTAALTKAVNLAGTEEPDEGRTHIPVGSSHDAYKTNPPTSGSHYAEPAAWGVYETALPDEQLVHNLEHGGIWISYKPNIDADTKAKLIDLGKQYPKAVIVTPRANNPHSIEVASWRRLMDLDSFERNKIVDFIKRNKNQSPEPEAQ